MNLIRQFIASLVDGVIEISKLRQSIDEHTRAIRSQHERQREQEQTQRELPQQLLLVKAEIHEPANSKPDNNTYRQTQLRWEGLTAIATSLAFIAAALYAFIAGRQLNQMSKATQTDQRPYVISDGRPKFIALPDTLHPEVNVAFKDVGKTPALSEIAFQRLILFRDLSVSRSREENASRFNAFIQRQFDDLNAEANKASKSALYGRQDIAPGQTSPWFTMELFEPMTRDDLLKIAAGETVLVSLGLERYFDSFGTEYQSDFCSFYIGNNPEVWHYCGTHNTVR